MNISKGLLIPTLLALLSACGGGGGGSSAEASKVNTPVTEDNGAVFIAKRSIQTGEFCANGGIEIDMGIDVNINGQLDPDEITKTERVCNGQDGLSGQSSLVSLTPSTDESCPYGGTDINVGADINANGVLDSQEITGSTLICHTTTEITEEFGLSAKGKISGVLNLPIAPAAKNLSASSIQPFAVTSQTGELWLTPNSIVAAIQADQTATDQAQQPTTANSLVAPVIEAIKVPVNSDGTFEVEVPAGTDYELTYITVDGTEGIQIGDLAVEPNTETPVTIESADLQATGSVSVKLQSLATGTALQNVNIVLLNGGINMLSGSSGIALLENLAPGQYTLQAHADGYVSKTYSFTVVSGVTTDLGFLELNNQRGRASGTVTALGLNSQANIVVYARDVQGSVYSTLTDSNGIFTFNALPVGEGYSFIALANDFNSNKKDSIDVQLGKTASVGDIELTPLLNSNGVGSITGFAKFSEYETVLNAHAGIVVSVEGTDKEAITSRDGAYIINGLAAGTYTLNFTDSNHQTNTLQNVLVAKTTSSNIDPQSLTSLTGSLTGKVVDGNNIAIGNATVLIQETGVTVQTDENGLFAFTDVYTGNFTILVSKDGYQGFSTIVEVQADISKALGDFNIDAYSISGTVNLPNGGDHSGVLVSIKGTSFTAVTDINGDFILNGMPVGNYEVQVSMQGFKSQSININLSTQQPNVTLGDTVSLVQYSLSGKVNLANNTDNSAVTLTLLGTSFSTQTDAEGNFTLSAIPLGNYKLFASKAGYQNQEASISISSDNPVATLSYTLELPEAVGEVSGVVTLENKVAHGGVTVTLLNTDYSTQTDNLGSWSLMLPVGNYGAGIQYSKNLYVSHIEAETVSVADQGEYRAQVQTLIQNAMILVIPVTSAGSCSQLEVWLQGQSGSAIGFDQTFSVSNGEVRVTAPYGEYRVETRCQDAGFETSVQNITLSNDNTGQLIAALTAIELRQSYVNINNNEALTNNANVTLALGSTTADEMSISGDTSATGWIPFSSTHLLTLTGGQGINTIQVEYRDVNDLSLGTNQDTITLDSSITISDFTATGATTKGDSLLVSLNLNGDLNASVTASLPGLFTDNVLLDNGVNGDSVANDGIYSRAFNINTSLEINAAVSATATDAAGNSTSASTDANVVTNSAPSILNLQISSNIATQEMNISFDSDEATTSSISWGDAADNLTNTQVVSSVLSPNHNTLLAGLSSVNLTYYQITVTDAATNVTNKTGINKLAPAQVENVIAQPGDLEIGVVWNPNEHPYTDGYRVYRSEDNAVFTLVNPDQLLKGSYFVDDATQNGTLYYYKVSAVDRDGNEGIKSLATSTSADSALAGPTVITEDELWGEHVWIASRSPYVINKDLTTRHKARLRALPGTNIQLDTTNGAVEFKTSNVGQVWLTGEEGKRVIVEQVGPLGGEIAFNAQDDKAAVFFTQEVDPVNRYTLDYFPLSGEILRYVDFKKEADLAMAQYSYVIGHHINAIGISHLSFDLLDGGVFRNSMIYAATAKSIDVTFDIAFPTRPGWYNYSNFTSLSNSTITAVGEGRSWDMTFQHAENVDFDNVQLINGSIKRSRLKDTLNSHSGQYLIVTESVIESTNNCEGVNFSSVRNTIWLDKTLAELSACGVTDLYKYLPFLTSEDPLNDQDDDGISDQVDHDSDNDGFSDLQELTLSQTFDPFDANSKPDALVVLDHDGDNIPDATDTDDDNDGISDVDEIALGTSPYWVDSDGDGIADKIEIDHGFNALDASNMPLSEVYVGIDLDDSRYKNQDGKTVLLDYSSAASIRFDISYFYKDNSNPKCYFCEVPANKTIYMATPDTVTGTNSGYIDLGHLSNAFEAGSRLQFVVDADNLTDNFNVYLIDSQLVNVTHGSSEIRLNIQNSAMAFSRVNGNGSASYLYKSEALEELTWSGLIKKSIISLLGENSQAIDSHLKVTTGFNQYFAANSVIRNSAIMPNNTNLARIGGYGTGDATYIYDSYIQDVILQHTTVIDSDYIWSDSSIRTLNNTSLFLNSSYLEIDGNNILSVGSSPDNLGDGIVDTAVDYTDLAGSPRTFTVDGIASPKSTPYFPGGADSVILLNDIGPQ